MSGACRRCGGAAESGDRFCGYCGAPLGAEPVVARPVAAAGANRSDSQPGRAGCGCGTVGCLGLLLLLGGGAAAGWYFVSGNDPEALLASAVTSIEELVGRGNGAGPMHDVEPDGESDVEVGEAPGERRDLSDDERAALAQTARGNGPASQRLGAAAALLQAGASDADLAELEAQQARALAEIDAAIAGESERRESFVKEAASGEWLRASGAAADAVWSAAGGR